MTITAATLFSGIGAPEVAMPHWRWVWCAEIEQFPSALLEARHPHSINLGDVTAPDFTERAINAGRPDVIVFGSPCQSFSVAGKRLGLDDPRGNLALVALGIVARLKPAWFCFENVPGLLSSAGGADFGIFLRAVDELGYHVAWTSLDAQYFGVAQRRERVFAVGHIGDWRGPAAVLFEPEGLRGHHPPRREAGERVAPTIASRPTGGGGLGTDFDCDGGLVAVFGGNNMSGPIDVATARLGHAVPHGRLDFGSETFVTHSLRADSFDAGEDGTGRGTPLVPVIADPISANKGRTYSNAGNNPRPRNVVAMDTTQITSPANRSNPKVGDPCHPLAAGAHVPMVVDLQNCAMGGDLLGTLDTTRPGRGGGQAVAFDITGVPATSGGRETDIHTPLRARSPGQSEASTTTVIATSAVRRLTPRECERLQGFPDDYTLVTYRNKPAADGPRYKALGNSMAVPVVRWILERIERVSALKPDERDNG
jgi:DNA (cytosine-5)-methyltransferase 1